MYLTEAEGINKRWQEYTGKKKSNQKCLYELDNQDGVINHIEPDILECAVKWALGSIAMNKTRGSDGIPADLFQILKDDAVKVLHSICQQIFSKLSSDLTTGKRAVFIPIPKKHNTKEC